AWVDSLSKTELEEIARNYARSKGKDAGLAEHYESVFGKATNEEGEETDESGNEVDTESDVLTFNNRQRLVILAEGFDPELEQSLRYLRTRHGMDINAIEFTVHKAGEDILINTTQIVGREQPSAPTTPRTPGIRQEAYRRFFERLRYRLQEEYGFPGGSIGRSWMNASAEVSGVRHNGIRYDASFAKSGRVRVGLYIDLGTAQENKAFFDSAYSQREHVEKAFGEPLQWERLDHRKASRITVYREGHIDDDEEERQSIADWMVDSVVKLRDNVVPLISRVSGSEK
ncbi:MAG: DUF4268 domain-containing protein, partial [Chloroflexi bacterium]|nr:DUF4268 domain-containing protein [Chloroflexota bacterium]